MFKGMNIIRSMALSMGLMMATFNNLWAADFTVESLTMELSPSEGTQVVSGTTFTLEVDTPGETLPLQVEVVGSGGTGGGMFSAQEVGIPPVVLDVPVPWALTGPFSISVSGTNGDPGTMVVKTASKEISLMAIPDPSEVPVSIRTPSRIVLKPPVVGEPADAKNLYTTAEYTDGRWRDVSLGVFGTVYASSDPSIATVNADGLVSAVSAGIAFIKVEYQGVSDWVQVSVKDGYQAPVIDYTGQIAINAGEFRLDPGSGLFVQQVSFTNETDWPIPEPISIVVSGLPEGVNMPENRNETRQVEPLGSPIVPVILPLDKRFLRPGEMASVVFKFRNKDRLPVRYNARLVGGAFP